MSPLWRSPTSSPGSPGRCYGAAKGSSSGDCPWRPSCWSGQSRSALTDRCGLREAISRSPDSRTPLRKPGLKNGVIRRREVYEHPSAPISILAGRSPPKPDTLQRALRNRPRSASASISRLLSQRLRNLSAWLLLTTLTFPTRRCLFYIPAIAGLQCWRVCKGKSYSGIFAVRRPFLRATAKTVPKCTT